MKNRLTTLILIILSIVFMTACGSKTFAQPGAVDYPENEGITCSSTLYAYYLSEEGDAIVISSFSKDIVVHYEYDDWTNDFDARYLHDSIEETDQEDFIRFQSDVAKWVDSANENLADAGFPMLGVAIVSNIQEKYEGTPGYYLNNLSSVDLDEPGYSREILCDPGYTDVWVEAHIYGSGDWAFYRNKLSFSDEQSSLTVTVPLDEILSGEYATSYYRVEDAMYFGDPAEVAYPYGSFRLIYGSPNMSYLRSAMNTLPYSVIYQTQPDGVTFGVFADIDH